MRRILSQRKFTVTNCIHGMPLFTQGTSESPPSSHHKLLCTFSMSHWRCHQQWNNLFRPCPLDDLCVRYPHVPSSCRWFPLLPSSSRWFPLLHFPPLPPLFCPPSCRRHPCHVRHRSFADCSAPSAPAIILLTRRTPLMFPSSCYRAENQKEKVSSHPETLG